jgi:NAD(P)-dependent dehydrogenase (short-subunit alcohol dehydrogenase family)
MSGAISGIVTAQLHVAALMEATSILQGRSPNLLPSWYASPAQSPAADLLSHADETKNVARQDIMAVNLNGTFNVTQAFLGSLRATKGRIVNIGSIQSFVHVRTPNSPAYTTSTHGVLGFTGALAAELGKHGVRVNAIGPGWSKRR